MTSHHQIDHPNTPLDEFHRFLLLSTVRGAGRTLRARSLPWSIIWAVSVVGFVCISFYFGSNLVSQYKEYHTFFQNYYNFRSDEAPFPSVTVCNLQPLSKKLIKRIRNNSFTSENKLLYKLKLLKNFSKHVPMTSSLSTKSFFMQNWPSNALKNHGLQFDEFVLPGTCNFTFSQNQRIHQSGCSNFSIRIIPHPEFFQCFMITPNDSVRNQTFSLDMDLYLDTEDKVCSNCSNYLFDLEDSIGAHVVVHTANTYPEISQRGIHIQPGTKTTIEIMETRLKQFEKSLNQCTDQMTTNLSIYEKSIQFAYDASVCQKVHTQDKVAKMCKCVDAAYPISTKHMHLPYCVDIKQKNFLDMYQCSILVENMDEACQVCKNSCDYLLYRSTAFQSQWPPKYNELDFYKLRVQGRPHFGKKFELYEKIIRLIKNENYTTAKRLLHSTNLIHDNFVRLRVFRPALSLTVSKETLQITLDALVSQIGGVFTLWCGVTVITLVELSEFGYYLMKQFRKMLFNSAKNKSEIAKLPISVDADSKTTTDEYRSLFQEISGNSS